jgi:hypothetical protein
MSYQITLHEKPNYLHFIITGECTFENVMGYLEEGLEICRSKDRSRVLIEDRLEGPSLGMLDMVHVAFEGSKKARGIMREIAVVDNVSGSHLTKFAANLASSRGLNVKVFDGVAEAEVWLMNLAVERV